MTERPPGGDPGRGARHRPARSVQTPAQRRRIEDVARGAAFDVLREVADSDAYANLVLPPMLRARRITGRDAGFATELAYGTLRLRGRYDAIIAQVASRDLATIDPPVLDLLRLGSHQLLGMRVPAHAAVSETVALARSRAGAGSAQFVNAVLRKVSGRELAEWLATIDATMPNDPLEALAVRESHPSWILRALREALVGHGRAASELEALLRADNEAPEVTLVARPGLVEAADLIAELHGSARPGPWTPTAVRMSGGDPGAIRAVRDGRAGVQDEGSQLVTLALVAADVTTAGGPDAGETWLDLCAGPGGKAALLAALAAQRGARLVANEVLPHRA
ncbi:MAG TPA: transcription antitermination factor NusB, partial [Candidatus Limnocylindrales bacterium]